ncbi:hypothetical protein NDR87_11920 [Nocardia sp. CDC159]|uniref:Uncharacterized protein n=1 Tax=Nocardia pulmonis TaxID=2951408 RepID=A0A9X2E4P2_9NOCA|nr:MULTISPECIES: hypothetical protein [Nocardia]MCM6774179.1 hypothetical protein [Nocardia pulmonis]MCM6787066.1 hypothetical protein [Nocardia sp. CDC159]
MNTWRDLDRATRKALLRGEPAANPEIDRIARVHAEKTLKRFDLWICVLLVVGGVITGVPLGYFSVKADLSPGAFGSILLIVMLGCAVVCTRRKLRLVRLLNASQGMPRRPVPPGEAERLEIRTSTWGVLRLMGFYLCVVVLLSVTGAVWSSWWLIGLAVVSGVPIVAYTGYLLYSSLSGHPLVLDADGVHAPHGRLRLGWESVREIRVFPLRATAKDTRQVIAFLFHDNQTYLGQLPRWESYLVRCGAKTFLSPMAIMDGLADKPVDQIAATAAALSGIPVTRSPHPSRRAEP